MAWADRPEAARMPIETRVSIEEDRCSACFRAPWWNERPRSPGRDRGSQEPLPAGNLVQGKIDSIRDRFVSGTKNTRARINRWRTAAASAVKPVSAEAGTVVRQTSRQPRPWRPGLRRGRGPGGDVGPFGGKVDSRGGAVDFVQFGLDRAAQAMPLITSSTSATSGASAAACPQGTAKSPTPSEEVP
jgi:hypothetical protein